MTTTFTDLTDAEVKHLAEEFLAREAKILDERRYDDWYQLLDDDIVYEVPIRQARHKFDDELTAGGFRIKDNKPLIDVRIKRLNSGQAWAEVGPSRTLRLIGSIFVERTDDPQVLTVESALLLYRQRGHDELGDVIPVRRTDQLRVTADGVKLYRRYAVLTTAILQTPNLGVFV